MSFRNSFGITREMILEIANETSRRIRIADEEVFRKYDIHMSNKNLSEIISKIMEKVAADVFSREFGYQVINAKSDKDPDLLFTKTRKKLEIKVTSTTSAWTGGEFSTRPFDYLLVSWGERFEEFFIAMTRLQEKDWKSNIAKRFYGPSYSIRRLHERKNKEIFLGDIFLNKRGNPQMMRENLSSRNSLKKFLDKK